MAEFTVGADELRQALATAVEFTHTGKEPLTVLAGVRFDGDGDGTLHLVATDRYVMSREILKAEGEVFAFTMPTAVVKDVIKMIPRPKRRGGVYGTVTIAEDGVMVVVRYSGADGGEAFAKFQPEADAFPSWRIPLDRVVKAKPGPVDTVLFAPKILARFAKALADRDDRTPIRFDFRNGTGTALVTTHDESFTALIMRVQNIDPAPAGTPGRSGKFS